jgi:hypothetical protein
VLHLNSELDGDDKEASEALFLTFSDILGHYSAIDVGKKMA